MSPPTPAPPTAPRLASLDAYRGFVMLLLLADLQLPRVARALPESGWWRFLAFHESHVEWVGCSLHDLIQPSFSFLVGVALPFSLASRQARGQRFPALLAHALGRSLLLILLGVILRSQYGTQTAWAFEDTLSQIGLGYPLLFLLGWRPVREQFLALVLLLAGCWLAFALYPLPPTDFDYAAVGVPAEWLREHGLHGFASHWQKNSNIAWAFDTWFLNLFPRATPFLFNKGGYATLSFLPTLGTMILGLLAGGMLRRPLAPRTRLAWLLGGGLVLLASGWLLGALGLCPVVKRIWTPSWVLYSGGWCCLLLGAFHALADVQSRAKWFLPLTVLGVNSIAAYLIANLFKSFIGQNLKIHLGADVFRMAGDAYAPLLHGAAVFLVMWLLLYWLYRRKIFLRV